ncbi:MAG: hypothetical protein LBQ47_03045 [Endomicrobium sp.]|nr:hypothetical protein [Endomicrobium sp.]
MNKSQLLGSQTAKNGFRNERDIADKFNNWEQDEEAKNWLIIMGYDLNGIEYVKAVVLTHIKPKPKSDVNVQITIKLKNAVDVENISVKLVSNEKGFNQIDKHKVDKYNEMWNIPDKVVNILKRFTGELSPTISNPRDSRRMFIDEFLETEQKELFDFLNQHKSLIISDILRGRGEFAAEWVLVAQKIKKNARWILKNINQVINYYDGKIILSPRGSIKIGKITVQRKGGTPDPTSLQFKINPAELFDI